MIKHYQTLHPLGSSIPRSSSQNSCGATGEASFISQHSSLGLCVSHGVGAHCKLLSLGKIETLRAAIVDVLVGVFELAHFGRGGVEKIIVMVIITTTLICLRYISSEI